MYFCTYVLPALLEDFKAQYPQVALTLCEGNSRSLGEKLLDGQLDFLLETEHPHDPGITTVPWAAEEIVLAVPASYPINRQLGPYCYTFAEFLLRGKQENKNPPVPLGSFQNEEFMFLQPDNDIHQRSLRICQNAGFTPRISLFLTQMMTAYYMVCEGRGLAFLRSSIPDHVAATDSVVFYQLDDPLALRNIYLSYAKCKAGPVRQYLIDYLNAKISFL